MNARAFTIARPVEGISINGLEYLLDQAGDPMTFPTQDAAAAFLQENGFDHLSLAEIIEAFTIEENAQ